MPWIVSQRLPLSQIEAPIDRAAAHRVAAQVEVQAVPAEHAFLAEVAELGVADRARPSRGGTWCGRGRRPGRPTRRRRCGSGWRPRRGSRRRRGGRTSSGWSSVSLVAVDGRDRCVPRSGVPSRTLGVNVFFDLFCRVVAVTMTRSPTCQPVTGSASVTSVSPALRGGAELDPGAAQRRAVEVHPAAAADDGRARLLVHALDVGKPIRAVFPAGGAPACRPARPAAACSIRLARWASQSKPSSL